MTSNNDAPNRHQAIVLWVVLAIFILISAWIVYRGYASNRDTFLAGAPPIDVQKALFPEKVDLSKMRPPALRPSDPIRYGSVTSAAAVIEFGDFDCENCRAMRSTLASVIQQYRGTVRLVWRDFPVTDEHPKSIEAAIFARCAGFQGKFWEAYDALFDAEIPKSESTFTKISRAIGLNANLLSACRQDEAVRAAVQLDLDTARNDGIDSAPFLFIGSKAVRGPISPETLKQEIDLFLAS